MSTPFQAGGELTPGSTAFDSAIYRQPPAATTKNYALRFVPQVIGSPRLSGKTTQVNTIYAYHQRAQGPSSVRRIDCVLPREVRDVTEDGLRHSLADKLAANPNGTLADILRTSRILQGSHERRVLAIINSEALAHSALRWLLAGFRAACENPEVTDTLRVQLLIDGSFGVETLTAHPESDYPLPQAFPPEFSRAEQMMFMARRLGGLSLRLSKTAMRQLWEGTQGDKFLTQAVGERLARDHFDPSRIAASRRPRAIEPRAVVQALDDPRQWEPLFTTAVTSIAQLVTLYANDDFRFQGFLNNVTERWATLASEVKSIAYEGGLVRRTGERDAIARAPIVTRVCNDAIDRAYQCLGVLRLGFSLNGVHNDDVGRARAAMTDVVRSAAAGRLVSLHAGFGRVAAHDTIKLTAFTADAGRYSGTWAAPTCSNRPGTPVWGLMWSVDGEDGRRSTHVEILKVGLRPPSRGEAEMTVGAAK